MVLKNQELTNQQVHEIGINCLSSELEKRSWSVSLATKEYKGIHLWVENYDEPIKKSIWFTCRSKNRYSVWIEDLADFIIISANVGTPEIEFYIVPVKDIRHLIIRGKEGSKDWIKVGDYTDFKDRWDLLSQQKTTKEQSNKQVINFYFKNCSVVINNRGNQNE